MAGDVEVPAFLACGGFYNELFRAVLQMSNGGTKSALHSAEMGALRGCEEIGPFIPAI